MLAEYPIHVALPATDLQRARRFYTETLGLTPEREGPDGLFFRCGGGTRFLLYASGGTASGAHTQMTWNTPCHRGDRGRAPSPRRGLRGVRHAGGEDRQWRGDAGREQGGQNYSL